MDKIKAWFKDSVTILWARVQYIGGLFAASLIIAFTGFDFTRLTAMTGADALKLLAALIVSGVITELARRRTL